MQRLIQEFEEQVRAELAADGDVQIGGVKMSPLAILDPGSETYNAEYLRWRDEEWLPSRFERLRTILALEPPNNRARFERLVDALKRQQVAAFVGAGMSLSSGMLLWADFLRKLREAPPEAKRCLSTELEKLLVGSEADYEAAADLVYMHMGKRLFMDQMRTHFHVPAPDIQGPVRLLPHLFHRWVFTTNYDNILEEV